MDAREVESKTQSYLREGKIVNALNFLTPLTELGDAGAEFCMGVVYMEDGDFHDLHEARRWFAKADEKGHPKGPYYLGLCAALEKDYASAMRFYEKSAKAGYHVAMARIGLHYLRGVGVEQSSEKAFSSFMDAKNSGNIAAHVKVARMLILGHKGVLGIPSGFLEYGKVIYRTVRYIFSTEWQEPEDAKEKIKA